VAGTPLVLGAGRTALDLLTTPLRDPLVNYRPGQGGRADLPRDQFAAARQCYSASELHGELRNRLGAAPHLEVGNRPRHLTGQFVCFQSERRSARLNRKPGQPSKQTSDGSVGMSAQGRSGLDFGVLVLAGEFVALADASQKIKGKRAVCVYFPSVVCEWQHAILVSCIAGAASRRESGTR
jgi:hypothetical protein